MNDQGLGGSWQPTFSYDGVARAYALALILVITGAMVWTLTWVGSSIGLRLVVLVIGIAPWFQVVAALRNPVTFRIADDTIHGYFYLGDEKIWNKSDLAVRPPSFAGTLLRTHEIVGRTGRLEFRVWPNLDDCNKFLAELS